MARLGDTFIDIVDPETLEDALERVADLSRVALLTVERLCSMEDGAPDEDLVLVQNMLWPLQLLADHAVRLERAARPPTLETPGDGKLAILDGGRA